MYRYFIFLPLAIIYGKPFAPCCFFLILVYTPTSYGSAQCSPQSIMQVPNRTASKTEVVRFNGVEGKMNMIVGYSIFMAS